LDHCRRGVLRPRRSAGPHHHTAHPAAGGRHSGRCRPADSRSNCRDGATAIAALTRPLTPRKIEEEAMYDNLLASVPTDPDIGGKWRKASDNQRFDVIDPATEKPIASVASTSVEDAKAAVDAASAAMEGWAAKKPRERAEVLRKAFELILRDTERFA